MSAWLGWAIATIGFAGVVTFCVAAPVAAAVAGRAIVAALIALLRTRTGCALLAAVVVFLATWIWRDGALNARWDAKWHAAVLESQAAAKQRDVDIAAALERKYGPKLAELDTLRNSLNRSKDDHAKQKPVSARGGCRLGPDALRMRNHAK
jgi:hypothetical protein